jgi:nicotinic acid mononucleotide adenylyltransferase
MADKKKKKPPVKNFKEFDPAQFIETEPKLTEAVKKDTVVISFGRMNPITVGHEKLVGKVLNVAQSQKADPAIFLSHTTDPKKNPLTYEEKLFFAQKAFGKVIKKSPARTIIEVAKQLQNMYKNMTVVVGSDRVKEFETLLNKYNGKDYKFNTINVVSAGERDPDSEGVSGMSASKMRSAAADDDFKSFKQGLPKKLQSTAKKIFDTTRQGMALDEETLEEAVLSRAARRKRARLLRRYKGKIALARKKAMRRRATLDTLKKRARKTARTMIKDKLAKSKRFADLDPTAKIAIEKRLEKMPSARLERLARRILPSIKRKETDRMQQRKKNESLNIDEQFEMFMEERTPSGRFGKNTHDIKVKVPGRINKAIKKGSPVWDQRENKPHQETKKHLSDIMKKHGVKPSKAKHYHNDMTGHYMMAHPSNDPAKVHAAATEFEKTVGKAVRTEAKDGDGVNIVRDREFKGKPMKKEPGTIGIKFSDMRKSKWAKDSDTNPKRSKAMGEATDLEEKLKASDDMGTWIKDFQDSDAPQFKDKSKEKRRQMAIAAKLDAEDDVKKESVQKGTHISDDPKAMARIEKFFKGLKHQPKGKDMKDMFGFMMKQMGYNPKTGLKEYNEDVDLDEAAHDPKHVKMAIGIASDKRYKGGDMTGAVKSIEKIKKGLSDHPQVSAVLRRQNEETKTESLDEMWGTYVSKRPHMLLDKNNKVKFDKRFKMFKKQNELEEEFTLNEEMDLVNDLENSVNEFVESNEFKEATEPKLSFKDIQKRMGKAK